jgi:hypothetical protein
MSEEVKTDFAFKGNRNYVHSSTLMEKLSEAIYENFYSVESWQMPKLDAQFRREIYYNGAFKISEHKSPSGEDIAAAATFKFYDSNKTVSAQFSEDEGMKVVRRIDTNYSINDIVLEKDFQGQCSINCSGFGALVENVIEANKRMHLLTLKNKGESLKVVNLYVKRFPASFAANEVQDVSKTFLKIENMSTRYRSDSVATLNSLYFPEVNIEAFELSFIVYWA